MTEKHRVPRVFKLLTATFMGLFLLGIAICGISASLSIRDGDGRVTLHEEIKAVEAITGVLWSADKKIVYVCYDGGSCVNAYDENGAFLWAVSIPFESHAQTLFCISETQLYLSRHDTYCYDAVTGAFQDFKPDFRVTDLDVTPILPDPNAPFTNDPLRVYRTNADCTKTVIAKKPFAILFLPPSVGFCLSLFGAISAGILILINNIRDRRSVSGSVKSKSAIKLIRYERISGAIFAAFTVLDMLLALIRIPIMIGIAPLTIYFIVSQIIVRYKFNPDSFSKTERKIAAMWNSILLACYLAAFLSVVITCVIYSV